MICVLPLHAVSSLVISIIDILLVLSRYTQLLWSESNGPALFAHLIFAEACILFTAVTPIILSASLEDLSVNPLVLLNDLVVPVANVINPVSLVNGSTTRQSSILYVSCRNLHCTFVSEIYAIEDCLYYQDCTSNAKESNWTIASPISSSSIFGYSSDGWKFGNASSYSSMTLDIQLPTEFELSFISTERSGNQPILYIDTATYIQYGSNNQTKWNIGGTNSVSDTFGLNIPYQFKKQGNTLSVYKDGTLLTSKNVNMGSSIVKFDTGSSRYLRIKDLKVKAL